MSDTLPPSVNHPLQPDQAHTRDSKETLAAPAMDSSPSIKQESQDVDQDPEAAQPAADLHQTPTNATTGPPANPLHQLAFITVLCLAQLLCQAGLAVSIAPLHIIGDSFGARDAGELSWMAAGYSLTVGTFILIAGRLGDLYGHKRLFIFGFAWFGLWSVVAGCSVWSGQILFDFCRAMQGIGPAFCVPNAVAIIGRTFPPGLKKDMIFCVFGATAPGGFVLGACFSSLFAQLVWWPWAYWVLAMVCGLVAASSLFLIPNEPAAPKTSDDSAWKRIDVPGAVTGVVGLVLINFAWNQGPVAGWPTPYVYVLLIVGFLFIGLFAWIESRAAHPLLPLNVFNGKTGFVLGCIAAGWSSFGIVLFYLWQILEQIRGHTPLLSTAQFAACAVSGACAAVTTGFLLGKLRPSVVMLCAMTAFLVSAILAATMPAHQVYWAQTFVLSILMPWGMDMSFPAGTIIMSTAMPKEHQGVAASLVNTVVNYSISIGLGIAGTVQQQISLGLGTSENDILTGFRSAFYVAIGLSGVGVLLAVVFVVWEVSVAKTEKAREKNGEQ